ncbi:MAG TPA: CHASE3 domain-containing protein [Chloroflexaceae bacterium]|nr:CHASE3 domain-containing protein [Chloroflexaceae bacterium]
MAMQGHNRGRAASRWRESYLLPGGLALLIVALVGATVYNTTAGLLAENRRLVQTYQVLDAIAATRLHLQAAETAQRGLILTGDPALGAQYADAQRQIAGQVAALRRLMADNADQLGRLDALGPLLAARAAELGRALEQADQGGLEAGAREVAANQRARTGAEIGALLDGLERAERELLARRAAAAAASAWRTQLLIVGAGALSAALALLAAAMVWRALDARNQALAAVQRANRRTSAILEAVGEAVVVAAPDGQVAYLNPTARALTGAPAAGQSWWDLLPDGDGARRGAIEAALATGQVWRGELVAERHDGGAFDAALTVAPLPDPEGGVRAGFVVVQRDVSTERLAERLKSQFVSNVSHELRTPISVITLQLSNLDLLYERLDDAQRRELIRDLRAHARLLGELVGDVLTIARIDSGRADGAVEVLDLDAVVRHELAQTTSLARQREQSLVLAGAGPLPVRASEGQLRQILRNLISNAVKYTPTGGRLACVWGRLTVAPPEAARTPAVATELLPPGVAPWPEHEALAPGAWAALAVIDHGIGIGPGDLPHVFERFYRASDQGEIPGTGLGLAIAAELAALQRGRLALASRPGRGTSAALYLPLSEEHHG